MRKELKFWDGTEEYLEKNEWFKYLNKFLHGKFWFEKLAMC